MPGSRRNRTSSLIARSAAALAVSLAFAAPALPGGLTQAQDAAPDVAPTLVAAPTAPPNATDAISNTVDALDTTEALTGALGTTDTFPPILPITAALDTTEAFTPALPTFDPAETLDTLAADPPPLPPFPAPEPAFPAPPPAPEGEPPPVVITETETAAPPIVALLNLGHRSRRGEIVHAALTLSASVAASDLTVIMTLPAGLDYDGKSAQAASYDPAARTLTWRGVRAEPGEHKPLDKLKLWVSVAEAPAALEVVTRLSGAPLTEPATSRAVVHVGREHAGVPERRGDRKTFKAGPRVTLDFPSGEPLAEREVTAVEYPAQRMARKADRGLWLEFGPPARFAAPVTLTVDVSGLLAPELLASGVEPALIYWPEQAEQVEIIGPGGKREKVSVHRSRRVPATYDPISGTLTAALDHFSLYEVVPALKAQAAPRPWKLAANLGTVGLFRGAANYAFPIEAPALPDGLGPQLALSYSSAAADGGARDDTNLGTGWSVDVPHVRQGIKFLRHDDYYPSTGAYATWYEVRVDHDYRLSLGGQEINLIPRGIKAGGYGEYVPESYAPVRVFKCQAWQPCNGQPALSWADWDYWQVWTPDGARWAFGGTGESTRYYNARGGAAAVQTWLLKRAYAPGRDDAYAGRWSQEYAYAETVLRGCGANAYGQVDCNQGYDYDARIRLVSARYGNSLGARWPQYDLALAYTSFNDDGRLQTVSVNHKTAAGGWATMRYYGLDYDYYGQLRLIRETAPEGGAWLALPPTTFTYGGYQPWQDDTKHLKVVDNGYGGQIEFSYWIGSGYRVVNGLAQRDRATGWASFKTYAYSGACFNIAGSACRTNHDWNEPSGALVGHAMVDEVQRAGAPFDWGSAALQVVRHSYYVDTAKAGRETETRVMDGAWTTLHLVRNSYDHWVAPNAGLPAGTWAVELSATRTYPVGDSGAGANYWSVVEHVYGNLQANPLIRRERAMYTRTSSGSGNRSDYLGYAWNTAAWIVKPAYQNTYDGAVAPEPGCGPAFRRQVILYYDGQNSNYNAAPTRGLITRAVQGSPCAPPAGSSYASEPYIAQEFGYDAAGNLTVAVDARGKVTRAEYDGTGLYMTALTNPVGHALRYTYYGINAAGLGGRGQHGQLEASIDANNAATAYSYDAFGRLKRMAKPLDTLLHPTIEVFYLDNNGARDTSGAFAPPLMVQTFARRNPGQGVVNPAFAEGAWAVCASCGVDLTNALAVWDRTLYDGFGRAIQVHKPGASWPAPANRNLAFTVYDVFGRPRLASTRYDAADSVPYYIAPDLSKPKTTTNYDALGRKTDVTGPDGATTRYYYALDGVGSIESIVDANGHAKHRVSDPLGRLVRVRDFVGTNPWAVYAETRFNYDGLGQLLAVIDAQSNQIELRYDALGRKRWMSDPDMGVWQYDYDAGGNLITQRDARGQVVQFEYDDASRVTKKTAGAIVDRYYYDRRPDGTPQPSAVGRRTQIERSQSSMWGNSASWEYDLRGRMISERRSYNVGHGDYTTQYSYDSADRVTALTYPDGEQVSTTYGTAGYATRLTSAQGTKYVAGASYTMQGQPGTIKLGNGLTTRYRYHGQAGEWPVGTWGNAYWGRIAQICVHVTSAGCGSWDNSASVRLNRIHSYDAVGNVRYVDDVTADTGLTFTYDDLDRLTSVRPVWGTGGYSDDFEYDTLGGLIRSSRLGQVSYGPMVSGRKLAHALYRISGPLGNLDVASYDANGNMTQRWDSGRWYGQEWNAENRLSRIWDMNDLSQELGYSYDPDGALIRKSRPDGRWAVYLGAHAEYTDGMATKYYWFNGQRIAKRDATGVYWLHGDHLGSASAATNAQGQLVATARYRPYGEVHQASGVLPTDRRFTGQREETGFGVYDYGARFYSPLFGRFISPDSIVPEPGNSQALNRYAYAYGNPMKYVDPSGHCPRPPFSLVQREVICVAAFIPTAISEGFLKRYRGDKRNFSAAGIRDKESSRMWLWFDADTGAILDPISGQPGGRATIHGTQSADDESFWIPRSDNRVEVRRSDDGDFVLEYSFRCSDEHLSCAAGPVGTITFKRNDFGTFDTEGVVVKFPNLEAYHWKDGELVATLFQIRVFSQEEEGRGVGSFGTGAAMILGVNYVWSHKMNSRHDALLSPYPR